MFTKDILNRRIVFIPSKLQSTVLKNLSSFPNDRFVRAKNHIYTARIYNNMRSAGFGPNSRNI